MLESATNNLKLDGVLYEITYIIITMTGRTVSLIAFKNPLSV